MKKVKNISKTTQRLYDKGGRPVLIHPGEVKEMIQPPIESYIFHIEEIEEKEEPKKKKIKKEDK